MLKRMMKQKKHLALSLAFVLILTMGFILFKPQEQKVSALTLNPSSGMPIQPDTTDPTEQAVRIQFNDPNLERKVYNWVHRLPSSNVPVDAAVKVGELQKCTGYLTADFVSDLEGLQYAKSMTGLTVSGASLVQGTTQLTTPNPVITTLAPLANLPNLTTFTYTGGSGPLDASALGTLPMLTTLSLNGLKANTQTDDFSYLLGIQDLEFLRTAPRLTTLTLASTGVTSLSGIENLTTLKTLKATNNTRLASVPDLAAATGLTTLNFQNNPLLSDLSFLQNCEQNFLRISFANYWYLAQEPNTLNTYDVGQLYTKRIVGKITDLSPLANIKANLLDLCGNEIADVSPLATASVTKLYLYGNRITDAGAIPDTVIVNAADQRIAYQPATLTFENPFRKADGSYAALKFYGYNLTYGVATTDTSKPQAASHPQNPDGSFDLSKIQINSQLRPTVTLDFGYRDQIAGSNRADSLETSFSGKVTMDVSKAKAPIPLIRFAGASDAENQKGIHEITVELAAGAKHLVREGISVDDGIGNDVSKTYTKYYHTNDFDKVLRYNLYYTNDQGVTKSPITVYEYGELDRDLPNPNQDNDDYYIAQVGDYVTEIAYTNQFNNTATAKQIIHVVDTTGPVITFTPGMENYEVTAGTTFDPYQYLNVSDLSEAYDPADPSYSRLLRIVSNPVNVNKAGVYDVVYDAVDRFGNVSAPVTRKITVVDKIAPEIKGVYDLTIYLHGAFDPMAGVTATDNPEGDLTNRIVISGQVDSSLPGEYNLTYSVKDSGGNEGTATSTITVLEIPKPYSPLPEPTPQPGTNPSVPTDHTAPVMSGISDVEISCNDAFDPMAGITALDDQDGDVTRKIQVTGVVNPHIPGRYILTYVVSDSRGNMSPTGQRVVTVLDRAIPEIIGAEDVTLNYGAIFDPMLGVKAIDSDYGVITNRIVCTGKVNTQALGVYTLTYTVTDPSGKESKTDRKVTVVDTEKPVITGAAPISIPLNSKLNVMFSVTAKDLVDGDLTQQIKVSGTINSQVKGVYPLTYTVADSSGNEVSVVRQVTVK